MKRAETSLINETASALSTDLLLSSAKTGKNVEESFLLLAKKINV
jgi:hypothetical protein